MKLRNYTIHKSILGKMLGLMFSGKKTIVFEFSHEEKVSLHTFFVFFPIKVLFLDAQKKIVEQTTMKPFSFYMPQKKAQYVVELPFEVKTKTGEAVKFK